MVLGKFVYDIVVGVPATLVRRTLEGIVDEVNRERLVTEGSVKQRLQQLQLMLQDGQIGEEEYDRLETELIERLRAIREYHKEVVNGAAGEQG